jgi:hypothetical protein
VISVPAEKINYSPAETKLLQILRKQKKPVTSIELGDLYYDKKKPFHFQRQIIASMRGLIRKVEFNKEAFRIEQSERRGPHPAEFTLKSIKEDA